MILKCLYSTFCVILFLVYLVVDFITSNSWFSDFRYILLFPDIKMKELEQLPPHSFPISQFLSFVIIFTWITLPLISVMPIHISASSVDF